jgi:hypothetical protein
VKERVKGKGSRIKEQGLRTEIPKTFRGSRLERMFTPDERGIKGV